MTINSLIAYAYTNKLDFDKDIAILSESIVDNGETALVEDYPSFAISLYKEYRRQGIGSQLMVKMLELLKWQGYVKASLAVQKANYAVKMYKNVGFEIIDENDEEYIMVCEL